MSGETHRGLSPDDVRERVEIRELREGTPGPKRPTGSRGAPVCRRPNRDYRREPPFDAILGIGRALGERPRDTTGVEIEVEAVTDQESVSENA